MSYVVNPNVVKNAANLALEWKSADPFPHVVIDDFFAPEFCSAVQRDFPPFEKGCALNEQGLPGGKATFEDVRTLGPTYRSLDDHIKSKAFLKLMSSITGIPDLMYDPDYIGGGTHENRNLQELDPHVDFNYHPKRRWHRRCNLIVYLNPEWQEDWGGSLEIQSNPWDLKENRVKTVVPICNRAVLFETSECSWHAFRRITPPRDKAEVSRRSFAIYLYTESRPQELTAPPHSTVYVERPLPASIEVGKPLRPSDALAIERMVHRRVQHTRRIFEREQKFALDMLGELARIAGGAGTLITPELEADLQWLVKTQDEALKFIYGREPLFTGRLERLSRAKALAKATTGRLFLGAAKLRGKIQGQYWDDGWVGSEWRCTIDATADAKLLEILGYFPIEIGNAVVQVQFGAHTFVTKATAGRFVWSFPITMDRKSSVSLAIISEKTFRPSALGTSADERELAFYLESIYLE